eukprot:2348365-Pyramimonas_sp.AAC.1
MLKQAVGVEDLVFRKRHPHGLANLAERWVHNAHRWERGGESNWMPSKSVAVESFQHSPLLAALASVSPVGQTSKLQ